MTTQKKNLQYGVNRVTQKNPEKFLHDFRLKKQY